MTALHPFRVADAAAEEKLDPLTLEAVVKGTLFVIGTSDTLGNITQSSGEIALAVAWAKTGLIYYYDSTDTTTADDGTTCLVDGSGHRYKLEDSASIKVSSVLALQNDPPVSPSVGDAYVVGTVPTGAWVGYANDIAIYTRRGWVFAVPEIGTTVLNQATNLNIQFNDSSAWAAFASTNTDSSIRPRALEWPMGLAIEATQNSPPGSPSVGLYYIVGASPTGAWSGQSGKVATYYNSAWEFMSPYEGAEVYSRALGYSLTYISGAWGGQASSNVQTFATPGSFTWTKPSIGTMALIEVWAAGGSGGRSGSGQAGGGGGGAYCALWVPLASLGATEAVTVGAGGASITSGDTNGNPGGNSSFGSWLTAYGGGGGSSGGGGGGGGGQGSAGSTGSGTTGGNGGANGAGYGATTGAATGSPASGANSSTGNEGGSGAGKATGGSGVGGRSIRGGGGGGGGSSALAGQPGGNSDLGGAGGGGSNGGGFGDGAGGTSLHGGNGGAASHTTPAVAGAQPGGGGGAATGVNSGKGGDGMVRVSVF